MKSPLGRIRLASSGGFANLRFCGELPGQDLPEGLAQALVRTLQRGDLPAAVAPGAPDARAIRGAPKPFGAADTLQYELTVEAEDGETRRFAFDELAVAPEVLDLLDDLKAEILHRRSGAAEEE